MYKFFSLLLATLILPATFSTANANIYAREPAFCDAYATKSTSQYQTAQAARCDVSGLRWSDDFTGQRDWCKSVREDVAQAETRARAETLLSCFGKGVALNVSDLSLIPDDLGMEMIGAVRKGSLTRVQQLLAAGTDLDYEGMQGNDGKILFIAIGTEKLELVRFFIGLGLDPNGTFNGGFSPIAMVTGNHKLLEFLLENGGDANNTGELYDYRQLPLMAAIDARDVEAIQILLKHGARVQIDQMMDECTTDTMLDYAIQHSSPTVVAVLRKAGARTYQECAPQ
ncbi:ankyrin repeat domain-containing protein [uncultured Thiothrix sp.]|uniref:ankyrin repeat domain-containing protein n=1 Tax=uncultured Thiothrix sp. TaxID=223185 RepID=UPI00261C2388|nr:ankyrin repeat domain-containing protein [uncultured Thiothrix sp.]HRJ94750.1 ankyrin repeat domain-containing protein [Candidatus Thiothrix moscowensis]